MMLRATLCSLLATAAFAQERAEFDPAEIERMVDELVAAQDKGELTPAMAAQALCGQTAQVARTAAAIVRHEWVELPNELFDALGGKPRGARYLLDELARAPRPAAMAWVRNQAKPKEGRSVDHRLLALAARGEPLTQQESMLLLEALADDAAGDGFHFALQLVPEKIADRLLGRLHQGLLQRTYRVEHLAFLLDRLSPRGIKILLGLCVTLDAKEAEVLLRRVYDASPELVKERVADAVDGKVPLDLLWMNYAGHVLDSEPRIARIVEVLGEDTDEGMRDKAFEALLSAGIADERMLQVAIDDVTEGVYEQRVRRILMKAIHSVPADRLARWIGEAGPVQEAAVKAAVRRQQLERVVQDALLVLLEGVESATRGVVLDAVMALTQRGDGRALERIWPLVIGSPAWRDLLDRLGHREEPFVYQQLLSDLLDGEGDGVSERRDQQRDMLRLLLVGRNDRRELATLVEHAPGRDSMFLRRCRHYATRLETEHSRKLFADAIAADDMDVAAELLEWVAKAGGEDAQQKLWQLWTDPPESDVVEELLEIALHELAKGERRQDLLQQLRDAWTKGPLDDALTSLPYELLNSMRFPASRDDFAMCAELLLMPALVDGEGEQRRAQRWPDGTFGFPLVQAVATRLRGVDPVAVELSFAEVVTKVMADARAKNVSPQRLKVFWRALAAHRDLLLPLGCVTVPLWQQGEDDDVQQGAALWLRARRAELDRDYAAAERLYRLAAHDLLRHPSSRHEARWVLGERDPLAGSDPWARLAAKPHLMRLFAAIRQGNDDPAARALVREFAGYDRGALRQSEMKPTKESDK